MYINHSRIKTYQNCPRKYFWNYEFDGLGGKGLQFPGVDENLLIGTLVHAGLAEMYREGMPDTYIPAVKKALKEEYPEWDADPLEKNTWEENLKWCAQFLDDYYKNQFAKDEFTCLNIEVPFSVPLGNTEHQYVGRIDMIVNDNGDVILQAFKNDLTAHPLGTTPDWQAIAGLDQLVDDALGINTGSQPFTSGRAGFGFFTKDVTRRGFLDHVEVFRQL